MRGVGEENDSGGGGVFFTKEEKNMLNSFIVSRSAPPMNVNGSPLYRKKKRHCCGL